MAKKAKETKKEEELKSPEADIKAEAEKEMTNIHNGLNWVRVCAGCKADPCEC